MLCIHACIYFSSNYHFIHHFFKAYQSIILVILIMLILVYIYAYLVCEHHSPTQAVYVYIFITRVLKCVKHFSFFSSFNINIFFFYRHSLTFYLSYYTIFKHQRFYINKTSLRNKNILLYLTSLRGISTLR